jgi:polyisoprenoid-binding protein YceI
MTTATLTRPARTARPARPAPPAPPAPPARTATGPRSGAWVIDSTRAVAAFTGKASFLAPTISARFLGVDGSVEVAETARGLSGALDVAVDVTSMTTGNAAWDDLISSFDPFDSDHFPIAVYRSTRVEWTDGQARIDGTLTLRGVTRAVPLTASYTVARDGERMLVRAAGTVDRAAFGVPFDVPGCGKLLPRLLRLAIDVDVVLAA